ncbi:MAG: TonB-dependent receptor [Acidobacteria bacterium]|nr:TonB-dependent receptor [Acidobacteriota bacterium]
MVASTFFPYPRSLSITLRAASSLRAERAPRHREPRALRRTTAVVAWGIAAAIVIAAATALSAPPAAAQTTGTIEGRVADVQGLAVPGATVTLSGEELIAPLVSFTLVDGSYRFRALGRGSYDLTFELSGFGTLVREGVIVEGSRVIRIDAALEVATVAETVTVTGDAPVVDIRTTALVNDFGVEELQEVPSATDVWAVLGQTSGVRMRGFDVGGSHKSQQTGYESFGIRDQNRILADGIDTTEGDGGTGFYFDYYSIEEFTTTAAGADVEMTAPGSLVMMTMKSGGDVFSGMFHGDYEHESFVGDNRDADLESRGYTGNPNLLFFETHADLGGPILRDRAWFYGFYNHFRIDKAVSGVDRSVATDLGDFDNFGGKVTLRPSDRDRFIGYTQWGLKEKPKRGLSTDVGPDSVLAQASWSWAHKGEWQRIWNDRTFTTTAVKHFGFGWPMVPQVAPGPNPPRLDAATGRLSGAGWFPGVDGAPPFTFVRWKPQVTVSTSHYVPDFGGSHDLKVGYEFQIDSARFGSNANSGHVRYLDDSENDRPFHVDRIMLFSMPAEGEIASDNRNRHHAAYFQDTWRPTERLTLNLGVRYEQQHTYFLDAQSNPHFADFFPTGAIAGQTSVVWNTWAPRLGVTFALAERTVLKGHFGRYYVNLADSHGAANPASTSWIRYAFLDPNANGIYDGPEELGAKLAELGATGTTLRTIGTPIDPDLATEFVDEINVSLEHELRQDTALRVSYVRKDLNGDSGLWNGPQQEALLAGRGIACTADPDWDCPINVLAGAPIRVQRVPDDLAGTVDNRIAAFPGMHASYDTVQVAVDRRFTGGLLLQASFDYQWRDEFRAAAGETRSPLFADPLVVGSGGHGRIWQNHSLDVPARQATTNWGGRLLARIDLPWDVGLSANVRHQSGWPYAPIQRVDIPGTGTNQPIFLTNLAANRSENVTIVDLRLDKAIAAGARGRLTLMADFYNLLNANAVTNFSLRTGDYERIIAALDPLAMKLGLRFQW